MNNKLESLLGQEPSEEAEDYVPIKRNPVAQAYITKSALKKAYTYARLACDVLKESVECYGYLITPKNLADRVAREVYLAPNQEVGAAEVKLEGESVIKSGREIDKMGYRVLGWWHSHADFEPFHSGTDDENMMKILNAIAPINFVATNRQMPLMSGEIKVRRRGNGIELYDAHNPNKAFRLNLDSENFNKKDLGIVKSITANLPVRVGFAYSVVVNAAGSKPYCEIATKDFCGLCYSGEERSTKSRLIVLNQNPFEIDEKQIVKDIKKKIKKPVSFFSPVTDTINNFRGRRTKNNINSANPRENLSEEMSDPYGLLGGRVSDDGFIE